MSRFPFNRLPSYSLDSTFEEGIMRYHRIPTCAVLLLAIVAEISASQSQPNPLARREGIRLQVRVQNTTLPPTVRFRFLTGADSLDGVGRVVPAPYDQTFAIQQLRVRIEPTDPRAKVLVAVERWHEGTLQDQGSMTGKAVLVQVQGDVLRLASAPLRWFIWPVEVDVF